MAGAWIDGIGEGKKEFAGVRIIAAAVVGGTTSVITGGKFANGAMTAAFARAYNAEAGTSLKELIKTLSSHEKSQLIEALRSYDNLLGDIKSATSMERSAV